MRQIVGKGSLKKKRCVQILLSRISDLRVAYATKLDIRFRSPVKSERSSFCINQKAILKSLISYKLIKDVGPVNAHLLAHQYHHDCGDENYIYSNLSPIPIWLICQR